MKIMKKTLLYIRENVFQKTIIFVRFPPTTAQKGNDTKMVKNIHRASKDGGGVVNQSTEKISILGKNEKQ